MDKDQQFEKYKLDYEQASIYFHELHEVRFKLLAFLPTLSALAITFLQKMNSIQQILLGATGVVAVFGFTIYDQRNTQIYDRLTRRLKFIEKLIGFDALQSSKSKWGGTFTDRPPRRKVLGITLIWHDLGIAFIYTLSFLLWLFLLFDGIQQLCFPCLNKWILLAIFGVLYFIALMMLGYINDKENGRIDELILKDAENGG